jgi:uncharacterized sulfatase
LYPSQHGAWTLGAKLPESEHTVGEDFTKAGYKTALVGKAHFQQKKSTEQFPSLESVPLMQDLDFWRTFDQPFYGFEKVYLARGHTNESLVGQHYAVWMEDNGCDNWRDYFLPPTGTMDKSISYSWAIPEKYHCDNWIAETTNHLLEEYLNNNEPFFLWASFFDPHPPYFAPAPWDTMYDPEALTLPAVTPGEHERNPPHFQLTQQEKPDFSAYKESGYHNQGFMSHLKEQATLKKDMAVYYGMISLMDKYIGRILDKLEDLGLADNTVVVFTTDHGHLFGQHGLVAKGAFHYEDLLKIPMIVKYPGHVPAGERSDALQSLVDLAPTFLSMTGIPVPRKMTGVDQSEVWKGNRDQSQDHIICENHHEPTAIHLKTYVGERYKITVYYNHKYGELFDLQEDPNEINNLWDNSQFAELKSDLMFKYIWAELGKEPIWMPRK